MDRSAATPSDITNAGRGDERNVMESKEVTINIEHQAPEGRVAERKQIHTDITNTSRPVANKNIDWQELSKSKGLRGNGKLKKQRSPEHIENIMKFGETRHMQKSRKFDRSECTVRKIVGNTQKNGRAIYVVEWYGYSTKDDTMEPPKHPPHHFSARYRPRYEKCTTFANVKICEKWSKHYYGGFHDFKKTTFEKQSL